jgi:hypothetical protein
MKQEGTTLKKPRRPGKKTLERKHDKGIYPPGFHNIRNLLRYLGVNHTTERSIKKNNINFHAFHFLCLRGSVFCFNSLIPVYSGANSVKFLINPKIHLHLSGNSGITRSTS